MLAFEIAELVAWVAPVSKGLKIWPECRSLLMAQQPVLTTVRGQTGRFLVHPDFVCEGPQSTLIFPTEKQLR